MPCLIEALGGRSGVLTPLGEIGTGQFVFTYDLQNLMQGDRVMWKGLSYDLDTNQDDTNRPASDTTIEPMQVGKIKLDNLPALP